MKWIPLVFVYAILTGVLYAFIVWVTSVFSWNIGPELEVLCSAVLSAVLLILGGIFGITDHVDEGDEKV